ncbi:MAG: pepsin/retropepsin-like aspartic protease family protein [Opitutaceae bacterium]
MAEGLPGSRGSASRSSLEKYLRSLAYYPVSLTEVGRQRFITEARINEKTVTLLVDTGCPLTTLDVRRVPNLKSLGQLQTKLADSRLGQVSDPSILLINRLSIGGAQFSNQPARGAELEADYVRLNFDGLLGLDFLLRNFCVIDCNGEQIFFRGARPAPAQASAMAQSFQASGFVGIPIRCTNRLVVNAITDGEPLGWMIDTGANYSLLEESERVLLNLKPVERPSLGTFLPNDAEGRGSGLNSRGLGTHDLKVVCLQTLKVGPQTWRNLYVGVEDIKISKLGDSGRSMADVHGILGAELLVGHGAVIDFSSLTLWLRPDR